MQWTPGGVSGDIEDRRQGGGGRGTRLGLGGTLLLLLLSIIFRRDFISLFSGPGGPPPEQNFYPLIRQSAVSGFAIPSAAKTPLPTDSHTLI
jgi:hypothetical protein